MNISKIDIIPKFFKNSIEWKPNILLVKWMNLFWSFSPVFENSIDLKVAESKLHILGYNYCVLAQFEVLLHKLWTKKTFEIFNGKVAYKMLVQLTPVGDLKA